MLKETNSKKSFITNVYLLSKCVSLMWSLVTQVVSLEHSMSMVTIDSFDNETLKSIYLFSLLRIPYSNLSQKEREKVGKTREISEGWLTPNPELVYKVIAIQKTLSHPKSPMKKFFDLCGRKNVWIVKKYPDESHI